VKSKDTTNLKLHQAKTTQRSRELQLVESLARETITERNVRAVMQRFADELARLFEFRTVIVTQYLPHRQMFRVLGVAPQSQFIRSAQKVMGIDLADFEYPYDPEKSMIHAGLLKGQRWIGTDFSPFVELMVPAKFARAAQRLAGVGGLYNSPLLVGKTLVGTFIIGQREPEFSEEMLEFLNAVTPYVSMAVLQARLLDENKILADRYKLLTQVDNQILEERDLEKVLRAIVQTVPDLVTCDLSGIHLYDDARAVLVPSLCRSQSKVARKLFEVEIALGIGVLGNIAEKKKPEIVNCAQKDSRSSYPTKNQPKVEHLVVVPLLSKHTLLGTLQIARYHDEPFQTDDLEIAKRLAEKSALAIENAQLFTERLERERELNQLQKSGVVISGSLDSLEVLSRLIEESLKLIPTADRGAVFRIHGENQLISLIATRGFGIDKKRSKSLQVAERMVHAVARDRGGIVIQDPTDLDVLGYGVLSKGGVEFQSALCAPIFLKEQLYAVVYLDGSSTSKLLGHYDLARLELFLLNTSLSLSNAQLHTATEFEVKKVKLLFQIKKLAHERPDTSELLQRIARMVHETHRYSFVSIFLYEKRRRVLRMVAKDGPEAERVPMPYEQSIDEGILGYVARTKTSKVVQDVERDQTYIRKHALSTKSELCVPIIDAGDMLLGVINVESDERYGISDSDVDTLLAIATEISSVFEEHRLLEALSQSEKQYRSLVEHANDSVVLIDRAGKFKFVNKSFSIVTGYTLEDVQGREFGFMVVPEDLESMKSWFLASLRRQAERARSRVRVICKSGDIRIAEFNGRLIREGGEILGIMGIGRDITDEVRLQERLQEAEVRYSRYVSSTSEGIWRKEFVPPIDLNQRFEKIIQAYKDCGRMVEVNPALARMYGAKDASEIIGKSFLEVVEDWKLYERGVRRFLDQGCRLSNWETKERDCNGNVKYFRNEYVGEVIEGKLCQMWGAQTDVTEAKLVEQALYDSEKQYRDLFEQSKDAIFISSPDGSLLEANQAAVELFGFASKEELLAVDIPRDLYVDPNARLESMQKLNRDGFLRDHMLLLRKKTGEPIDVLETTTAIIDSEGYTVAYQGILRDVTQQKRAQQALLESEEKYRHLVEDVLVGVYIIQNDKFVFVNRRFAEIYGHNEPGEIVGKFYVLDLVVEEDREVVSENIRLSLDGKAQGLRYSFRGRRQDGEIIEVELYGINSMYRGHPAIIGTIQDRTQERRSQREIAEWRQRYDFVIQSTGEVAYECNLATGEILWSKSFEHVLGYDPSNTRTDLTEWRNRVHEEDRGILASTIERAVRNSNPFEIEYRARRSDDSYIWINDRGFVVPSESGETTRILGIMRDRTKERELQDRLRSSELKYRLLYENANDAVVLLSEGNIIDCNPRAAEMFGCTREELLNREYFALSPSRQPSGANSEEFLRSRMKQASTESPQSFDFRHSREDGSAFEAEVRLNRFVFEDRTLIQAQIRDVTAEIQAQQELAKSEESYRRLVREAADAILVSDSEGRLIEVNDRACGLLGYSREELVKMDISVVLALSFVNTNKEYKKVYSNLVREGRTVISDIPMQRKDGSYFPAEINAVLLGNGLLQAIVRDLSERKHAEEELDQIYSIAAALHGQELFDHAVLAAAQLLKVGSVLVGRLSPDGKSLTVTSLIQDSVHRRDMTVRIEGTPLIEIVRRKSMYEVSSGAGDFFVGNGEVLKSDIESLLGLPMLDSRMNVSGLVCAFDETKRTFTEHEKKLLSVVAQRLSSELEMLEQRKREEQLSRELLQSQKMESLGTLAGGIAHDFNNILGAIMGYTKLLQPSIERFSPQAKYLESIEKSAQRAASFAKQLLGFAHSSTAEISPVSINEVLRETLQIIAGSFPKSIVIDTDMSNENPIVEGDQGQLSQVAMNLCINARDAILDNVDRTERGKLQIATSVFKPTESFIETHLAAEGRPYACVSICDNGIGMPPDVQQRIFEPFYTTEKGKGTGLGLSTVYGIIKHHKGVLEVESEVGRGSIFRVYLPLSSSRLEKAAEETSVSRSAQGQGETILVVDDEPLLLALLAEVLTSRGYHVLSARNGLEAVEIYRRERERIQLVLLDVVMPGMGGVEAFGKLKKINPDVKVIVCSGYAQDSAVREIVRNGAVGFMAKPYLTEDILEFVARNIGTQERGTRVQS